MKEESPRAHLPHNALGLSGATERGGQLKQFKKLVESRSIKGYKNWQSRCIFSLRRRETFQALGGSSHAGPQGHLPWRVPLQGAAASAGCTCWELQKKRWNSSLKFGSERRKAVNFQGWGQYTSVIAQTHYIRYLFDIILFKTCFQCPLSYIKYVFS